MALHGLRIEFNDEVGVLAALAAAIAGCGGNIVRVDVHEIDGQRVIDDVLVEIGSAIGLAELCQALRAAGALTVTSIRHDGRRIDAQVRALDGAASMMAAMVEDEEVALEPVLADLLLADAVRVLPLDETDDPLARRAIARGVPASGRGADGRALLALPHPEFEPRFVVVAERAVSVRFSATEVARLRAFLRVYDAAVAVVHRQRR